MAESAAATILQPVVDEVVKDAAAVVKRQFNYLCCFTSNINGMEIEAKTLDDATRGVQGEVERERENAQDIVPAVETWLTDSNDFKGKVDGILSEVPNIKSGCLRVTARYSLSKKAMKIVKAMKEHREKFKEIKSNGISKPKPPSATVPIPSVGTPYEFESRKKIEEKIMTILKGDDRDMIGIYGMGGLGKTFMAKKIRNRALKEHVFDEVVIAVVSQQVDKSNIQQQIADQLNLKLDEKQTSLARAVRLHERLNDSKRTLLILDDVWETLKLVELGIPCGSEGCKIFFTSRNSDALRGMDVGKVFGMEILSEEEAWLLFKGKAGACVDDMKLNSIVKEVVKECKGLPIALVTIGATMKDEMNERIWKDAKKQLMKANPKNIPDFIKEVYNPIEVSYTKLASEEAKSVFLICCLFPEDDDIHVDLLTYFCMGLRIYEDVKSLEEATNMTHALIRMLKNRSLLLDSELTYCVRMHDVVRDVCIFIAKQKGYIDGNESKWISSFERSDQLPLRLKFPNLRLLFLRNHFLKDEEEFKINNVNTFFKGIRDLYVLFVEEYPWASLPPTQSLKNLGTLILYSCKDLETLSSVGDLVNLEILICHDCGLIEELPVEIGRLNRLKILDLNRCGNLQSIGRGIISSLIGLEELKMLGSFNKWEADNKEDRKNAGLRELEPLTNLSCLDIEIENLALAAENIRLSSKFERFQIYIPQRRYSSYYENNVLELEWVEGTCLGYWIQMQLLRDTQRLILKGAGVNNVELAKIPDGIYASLFSNLSIIEIGGCPHLHNLRQLSIVGNDCFQHLEYLSIMECEVMEQVFLWNEENKNYSEVQNHHITKNFPKLKNVHLKDLPNLTTFCQGIEGIDFPVLVEMNITKSPKMTSMISTTCLTGIGSSLNNSGGTCNDDHHHSSHIICQQEKVSFGNCFKKLTISSGENLLHSLISSFRTLEELTIENNLSWFTSLIAESLVSLKVLQIYDCDETVKVIQDDDEEIAVSGGERRTLVFPNLWVLVLRNLRKLVTFYESKCDIEFPSLKYMIVTGCPNMTNITLGRLIAPNWEVWDIDLNHCLEVSSMKMKKLRILHVEYPLCHYKISESFFTGLDELSITCYHGSMSLFSSSIARNLINIRYLFIGLSDEIIQVIKDDDEEEKVASGGDKTSLFPKLERLRLHYLRKLVTFCEWNCDVELPSLKKVEIMYCPNMTNFTLGSLTTPILADIIIDYKNVDATKDLNGLLLQRFDRAKEAQEEKENEKEVEEEKQSNVFNNKEEKKDEKDNESEKEEEKQSNVVNNKERRSEQEEEIENEKEEEKQSNVINNKELKSEHEEKHMKGEIEEQQK